MNSTVSPYFQFGISRQGFACQATVPGIYIDGRKRENIELSLNDRKNAASF